jgi:hypothetical protein
MAARDGEAGLASAEGFNIACVRAERSADCSRWS